MEETMAGYQLCRAKAAKHPFYIESIDTNIYTIEELCFYFWQNVCLLDESILNQKLCKWIGEELGMEKLSGRLLDKIEDQAGLGEIVLPVFKEIGYLDSVEYRRIQDQIVKLEVQPDDIRRKIRADYLVEYGMYSGAVNIYRQIMQERSQGKLGLQFYANVLNNMAGAYARMFLFQEAADCLWQSYELVRSNAVYRRYLAILPYFLSDEAYRKRLEELRIPEEQLKSIENEKLQAVAEFAKKDLFRNAGREELKRFLQEEKKKYHKSRR